MIRITRTTFRRTSPARSLAGLLVALLVAFVSLAGAPGSVRAEDDAMETTLARARMRQTQAKEVCSGVLGIFCEANTQKVLAEEVGRLETKIKEYRAFKAVCTYSAKDTEKLNDLFEEVGQRYKSVELCFELVRISRDANLEWFGIFAGIFVVLFVIVLVVVLKTRKKKAPAQAYPPGYGPPQGQWPQQQQGQWPQQPPGGQWPQQGPR